MAERSSQRLTRLLNLVAALTETNLPLTARQLRARLGDDGPFDATARRLFERDKEELRALGIVLAVEDVYDDDGHLEQGYRIPRSQYALRLPDLSTDELAALQLAAGLVRIEGVEGGQGLWKLGTDAAGGEGDGLAALPAHPQLGPLFTALAARRPVTFRYQGAERRADPVRLDFARGRWYLRAYDHDRRAGRWFRLDRMDGVPRLGPAGDARVEVEDDGEREEVPDPWGIGDGEPVRARVRVDGPQAHIATAIVGEDAVVEEEDGAVVLELDVTHPDGFRSFVLGFGEHAEVLGPPSLRDEVVAWLRALAS